MIVIINSFSDFITNLTFPKPSTLYLLIIMVHTLSHRVYSYGIFMSLLLKMHHRTAAKKIIVFTEDRLLVRIENTAYVVLSTFIIIVNVNQMKVKLTT